METWKGSPSKSLLLFLRAESDWKRTCHPKFCKTKSLVKANLERNSDSNNWRQNWVPGLEEHICSEHSDIPPMASARYLKINVLFKIVEIYSIYAAKDPLRK